MVGHLIALWCLAAVVTLVPSLLIQKVSPVLGYVVAAVAILLLAAPVASVYRARHAGSSSAATTSQGSRGQPSQPFAPLADDEIVPLETVEADGIRRLRHPKFGFSLLHPGADYFDAQVAAFAMDNQLARATNGRPWTKTYLYSKKAGGAGFVIIILNRAVRTKEEFRELTSMLEQAFVQQSGTRSGPAPKVERLQDEMVWNADRRQSDMRLATPDMNFRIRAHALQPSDHAPYVVVMCLMSKEPNELDGVLESFVPPSSGTGPA